MFAINSAKIKTASRLWAWGSLSAAALLAACGGGGGSGGNAFPFSGSVIDGKIQGAKVCLDVNSNATCDAGEPTAVTDANGRYSFTYTGSSIAGMHVLAIVGTDAVDSDSGPVTSAYNMLAPATASSYVTPLTTLVSSEMLSSKSSASDAEKSVKASLDVSTDLLGKNVMDDTVLHKIAQVTTVAMASARGLIASDTSASGLSAADVMKHSVNLVRTQVLTQLVGAGGSVSVDTSGSQREMLAKVEANLTQPIAQIVSGSIENIVAATRSGDGSQVDLAAVFKRGLIIANQETGDYIDGSGTRQNQNWTGYIDALVAEFMQFDLSTATAPVTSTKRVLVDNQWFQRYTDGEEFSFDGSNWVRSGNEFNGRPTISGNCITMPIARTGNVTQTYCAVGKNLEGKRITDFVKDLCDPAKRNPSASCNANALFPQGAVAYDLTGTTNTDTYRLWASAEWTGYGDGVNPITRITGDGGLLDYLQNNRIYRGSNCRIGAALNTGDKNSKSGTIRWGLTTNGCADGSVTNFTEVTSFTVVTVGDREILKVAAPNLYRRMNPSDQHAYMIFGYMQGSQQAGMYNGDFTPANFKVSVPFTGNPSNGAQVVSPAVLDAILSQKGLTSFPYPSN